MMVKLCCGVVYEVMRYKQKQRTNNPEESRYYSITIREVLYSDLSDYYEPAVSSTQALSLEQVQDDLLRGVSGVEPPRQGGGGEAPPQGGGEGGGADTGAPWSLSPRPRS